ncbi:MAG: HAD hydrolase-like protein [Gemmatimonadota bacterium]
MRKLILFDIDGTLLSARGAPRRAFHRAMEEVYETAGPIGTYSFDGKTDPQIARELLRASGFEDAIITARMPDLWAAYLRELRAELQVPGHETHVYPGVRELIARLQEQKEELLLGLLTGNIAPGADLKLRSAGLDGIFAFGAFGSDAERRDALPPVAVERAHAHCGVRFHGADVVVIGDTPHDVACGRGIGVRAVAVATGRHDAGSLRACGADAVLEDFADTAAALAVLLG